MDVDTVSLKRDASCLVCMAAGDGVSCSAPKKTRLLPAYGEVTVFSTVTEAEDADRRIDERVKNWLGLGELLEVPITVYGPSHFSPASAYHQWFGAAAGDIGAREVACASEPGELQFEMTD